MKWIAVAAGMLGVAALPARLAGYRSWERLRAEPRLVPYAVSSQCMPMSAVQVGRARRTYGPHTDRWVVVFANALAMQTLKSRQATAFPAGAILAKEKLLRPGDPRPEGVGFMIKHADGAFAESGGWEFLYVPSGDSKLHVDGCVSCHRSGGVKDYVFGTVDEQ